MTLTQMLAACRQAGGLEPGQDRSAVGWNHAAERSCPSRGPSRPSRSPRLPTLTRRPTAPSNAAHALPVVSVGLQPTGLIGALGPPPGALQTRTHADVRTTSPRHAMLLSRNYRRHGCPTVVRETVCQSGAGVEQPDHESWPLATDSDFVATWESWMPMVAVGYVCTGLNR